ncbi:tetratricopeptide repeat protein [bacterium]|nr:tetratricopeptide repeat protein [bacterium]
MMKRLVQLFLLFSTITASCAYYNTFYNAEEAYNKAAEERKERLKKQGKTSAQANRNPYTTKQSVNSPTSIELKNYDKAIAKASKILQMYADSKYVDDALYMLGQCFFYKENFRNAERKFQELLQNYPESEYSEKSHLWLARSQLRLEMYEESEKRLQDIVSSRADRDIREEAMLSLGELYFHKEEFLLAAQKYRTAVQNIGDKKKRSKAAFQMGECYVKLNDFENAIPAYEQAVKYAIDAFTEDRALAKLAECNEKTQNYEQAIVNFQKLLNRDSYSEEWPITKIKLANNIYHQGGIDAAMDWYFAVIEDHPRTEGAAQAYYYLAELYKKEFAEYDSAYVNYGRVKKASRYSVMADSSEKQQDAIIQLLGLVEIVKRQEEAISGRVSSANDFDSFMGDVDESLLDDETRFELRKSRSLRRLKKFLFEYPGMFLPDSLVADSLLADSLDMVDSVWVRSDQLYGGLDNADDIASEYYDPNDDMSDYEQRLQQEKESLERKLGPKVVELAKNDYLQNKTSLAESYLFQFNQPEMAETHYQQLMKMPQDSTIRSLKPQILFTLAHIARVKRQDQTTSDSLIQILAQEFPRTAQGRQARKQLGLPSIEEEVDKVVITAFLEAERLFFDKQKPMAAIEQYFLVEKEHPNTDYAPKSLFAAGWVYENILMDNPSALAVYEELLSKYPTSQFAKKTAQKVETYEAEIKRLASLDDSLATGGDSLFAAADSLAITDSTQYLADADPANGNGHLKQNGVHPLGFDLPNFGPKDLVINRDFDGYLKTEPRRPSIVLKNSQNR